MSSEMMGMRYRLPGDPFMKYLGFLDWPCGAGDQAEAGTARKVFPFTSPHCAKPCSSRRMPSAAQSVREVTQPVVTHRINIHNIDNPGCAPSVT